jgi:hypothetical protein
MSDTASVYERHRITLNEYHRAVEAGVFEPDARGAFSNIIFAVDELLPPMWLGNVEPGG